MERPTRFEHARFLGDKRTQLVYDLDEWTDAEVIDEIVAAGVGTGGQIDPTQIHGSPLPCTSPPLP